MTLMNKWWINDVPSFSTCLLSHFIYFAINLGLYYFGWSTPASNQYDHHLTNTPLDDFLSPQIFRKSFRKYFAKTSTSSTVGQRFHWGALWKIRWVQLPLVGVLSLEACSLSRKDINSTWIMRAKVSFGTFTQLLGHLMGPCFYLRLLSTLF